MGEVRFQFIYLGIVSVIVDTVTVSVFVSGHVDVFQDESLTIKYCYESGWMNILLAIARLLLLSAIVRRGGHCGFKARLRTTTGEKDTSRVPFIFRPPNLPLLWLSLNGLLLCAEVIQLALSRGDWGGDRQWAGSERRMWKMAGCGLLSVISQFGCIRSLRVAAAALTASDVHERHIFLESIFGVADDLEEGQRNNSVSLLASDAANGDNRGLASQHQHGRRERSGGGSIEDLVETVPEWLHRVRERVDEARAGWSRKLNALGSELSRSVAVTTNSPASGRLQPGHRFPYSRAASRLLFFRLSDPGNSMRPPNATELLLSPDDALIATLLSLFAARDALVASLRLRDLDAHDPTRLRFYIPQLCTFLLYGAEGDVALQVKQWLLRKCAGEDGDDDEDYDEEDYEGVAADVNAGNDALEAKKPRRADPLGGVYFAHAMHWFLSAHALLDRSHASSALGSAPDKSHYAAQGAISSSSASSGSVFGETGDKASARTSLSREQLETGAVRSRAGKEAVAALLEEVRRCAASSAFKLLKGISVAADEREGDDNADERDSENHDTTTNRVSRSSSCSSVNTFDDGRLLLRADEVLFDRVLAPTSFLPPPQVFDLKSSLPSADSSDDSDSEFFEQHHHRRKHRRRSWNRSSKDNVEGDNDESDGRASEQSMGAATAVAPSRPVPAAYAAFGHKSLREPGEQHASDLKGTVAGGGTDDGSQVVSGAALVQQILPNGDHARRLVDQKALLSAVARAPHRQALLGFEAFDGTRAFIDALAELGRRLIPVPKRHRNQLLREGLRAIDAAFLPSNAIFFPLFGSSADVGGCKNRIFAIHPDESSTFSTKERVPILVCVEVIDYCLAEEQRRDQREAYQEHLRPGPSDAKALLSYLSSSPASKFSTRLSQLANVAARVTGSRSMLEAASNNTSFLPGSNTVAAATEDDFQRRRRRSWGGESFNGYDPVDLENSGFTDESGFESGFESNASFTGNGTGGRLGQWRTSAPADRVSRLPLPSPRVSLATDNHHHQVAEVGDTDAIPQGGEQRRRSRAHTAPVDLDDSFDDRGDKLLRATEVMPPTEAASSMSVPASAVQHGGGAKNGYVLEEALRCEPSPTEASYDGGGSLDGGLRMTPTKKLVAPCPPPGPPPFQGVTCAADGGKRSSEQRQKERERKPRVLFKEKWAEKEERLRKHSPIGHMPGWRLLPVIIKSNDDLRQEAFAAQLFTAMERIITAEFEKGGLSSSTVPVKPWLKPYCILATSSDAGVIEAVPDTVSLDALKRNDPYYTDLLDFFQRYFPASPVVPQSNLPESAHSSSPSSLQHYLASSGQEALLRNDQLQSPPQPPASQQTVHGNGTAVVSFDEARLNFVRSLAPYCVACYLLQLKDRHNGNILLDAAGHIVHIDFGFLFLSSPGGNLAFESAPFKLTYEMVHLMGGPHSGLFQVFRALCRATFLAFRRHSHQLTLLVDMMIDGHGDLPCWQGRPNDAAAEFRQRFQLQLNSDAAAGAFMNSLIDDSMNNWRTNWYDKYQRCCVGIF